MRSVKLDHRIPHGRITTEQQRAQDLSVAELVELLIHRGKVTNGFEALSLQQARELYSLLLVNPGL